MKNKNHPKKGEKITVEPIRNEKDINRIKKMLRTNTRDLLSFTIGINNGLRIGDLLKLKVGDVRDLKVGECLTIYEQKTGKQNILMINKGIHAVLKNHLKSEEWDDDDYLFQSRKGKNCPLAVSSVNRMVKEWTFGNGVFDFKFGICNSCCSCTGRRTRPSHVPHSSCKFDG